VSRRSTRVLAAFAALGALLALQPSAGAATASSGCLGTDVEPGDPLVDLVDDVHNETFCLHAGIYDVGGRTLELSDGVALIGEPVVISVAGVIDAPTKIVGHSPEGVIDMGRSTDVSLMNLDVSGATGRRSDEDPRSKHYGRGIQGGERLTVRYVVSHDNAATGISGFGGGTVLDHVELYGNGSASYLGCCSGGVKSADDYTITNSFVHDNLGVGIWQDVDGTDFVVTHDVVVANSRSGIRYEHNQRAPGSAYIVDNEVAHNNSERRKADAGGVIVNSAPNAYVASNHVHGNFGAGIAVRGARGPTTGARIVGNDLASNVLEGCELRRVACRRNSRT
jgi:Right handed beta helix region